MDLNIAVIGVNGAIGQALITELTQKQRYSFSKNIKPLVFIPRQPWNSKLTMNN